jgi:hypothetical protein
MKQFYLLRSTSHLIRYVLCLLLLLLIQTGYGQTPYVMQTGDYNESFANISAWSNNFTSGTGAAPFKGVAVSTAGPIPAGGTTTISSATFKTGTTGGIQKGSSQTPAVNSLVFLATGNTENSTATAVDLFLDFSGREAGQLTFDWASLVNATGNRTASLKVYTSLDGVNFTELTGAAVNNQINGIPTTGTSGPVALPATFNNAATARLRFYCHNGNGIGVTGSRPKLMLDNINVTSTPLPTIVSLNPNTVVAGSSSFSFVITGTNYTATSIGTFNGVDLPTTYLWANQILVSLSAGLIATPGSYPVTVREGSKHSNIVSFYVTGDYYAKSTGNLNVLSTFGSNTDGSGTSPASFSGDAQTLHINGTGRTISSSWTVNGATSKVLMENNATLVIPAAYNLTAPVELSSGCKLTINTTAAPGVVLSAMDATSTVEFAQNTTFSVPTVAGAGYGNLILRNGTKTLPASLVVRGNLEIDGVAALGGTTLSLGGNLTSKGAVTFDPANKIALTTTNTGAVQMLNGNGGTLELLSLTTTANTPGVALDENTNLILGSATGGGYTLGSNSTLALNGNTLSLFPGGKATIAGGGSLTMTPASSLVLSKNGPSALGTLRLTAGSNRLNNLTIDAIGGAALTNNNVTMGSSMEVNGTLTLSNGQLTLNNNTLTINGAIVTGPSATAQINASGGSSMVFGGTGPIGILTFASGTGQALRNLTMNRTAPDTTTVRIATMLTIYTTLTLTRGSLRFLNGNRLAFNTGGTFVGGNAVSYVNAMSLNAVTNGSTPVAGLVYPMGSAGNYRPVSLSVASSTGTATYTVRQMEGTPTSRTMPVSLKRVSQIRYFNIQREAGGTGTMTGATVGLSFGSDDRVTTPATLRVARVDPTDNTKWVNINGTYAAPYVTSDPITSFTGGGDFVLAANDPLPTNPLPVELTSFEARRSSNGQVQVMWRTASESQSSHFEIQRRVDGLSETFQAMGTVAAQGSSSTPKAYAWTDHNAPASLLYYRLRQVDLDGSSSYSQVVAVASGLGKFELYPNPATDVLVVLLPAEQVGQPVRLLDLQGREVLSSILGMRGELKVGHLAAGTYLVQIGKGGAGLTQRLVKL